MHVLSLLMVRNSAHGSSLIASALQPTRAEKSLIAHENVSGDDAAGPVEASENSALATAILLAKEPLEAQYWHTTGDQPGWLLLRSKANVQLTSVDVFLSVVGPRAESLHVTAGPSVDELQPVFDAVIGDGKLKIAVPLQGQRIIRLAFAGSHGAGRVVQLLVNGTRSKTDEKAFASFQQLLQRRSPVDDAEMQSLPRFEQGLRQLIGGVLFNRFEPLRAVRCSSRCTQLDCSTLEQAAIVAFDGCAECRAYSWRQFMRRGRAQWHRSRVCNSMARGVRRSAPAGVAKHNHRRLLGRAWPGHCRVFAAGTAKLQTRASVHGPSSQGL